MARQHTAHRWRIASRCPSCRARLLSVCAYRNCTATRDDRPTITYPGRRRIRRRVHACGVSTNINRAIDLIATAHNIFDVAAPALPLGD